MAHKHSARASVDSKLISSNGLVYGAKSVPDSGAA